MAVPAKGGGCQYLGKENGVRWGFGQLLSPALMMTDWVVSAIGVCDVPDTLV